MVDIFCLRAQRYALSWKKPRKTISIIVKITLFKYQVRLTKGGKHHGLYMSLQ